MRVLAVFDYNPDSFLRWWINWTAWLVAEEDTIATSTWTTDTDDLTLSYPTSDGYVNVVWITGGTIGKRYRVTNHIITTIRAEKQDSSILLICKDL
jgi:hypothetical protein